MVQEELMKHTLNHTAHTHTAHRLMIGNAVTSYLGYDVGLEVRVTFPVQEMKHNDHN